MHEMLPGKLEDQQHHYALCFCTQVYVSLAELQLHVIHTGTISCTALIRRAVIGTVVIFARIAIIIGTRHRVRDSAAARRCQGRALGPWCGGTAGKKRAHLVVAIEEPLHSL